MQHPRDISIQDFYYDLPDDRIARYPLPVRDQSKLLVWERGRISDRQFTDLPRLLPPDAALVFNQSSVINARLLFRNSRGADIEVFCLEPEGGYTEGLQGRGTVTWRCLVGRLKKWKSGPLTIFHDNVELSATLLDRGQDHVLIRFNWKPDDLTFAEVLGVLGALPIPPYLNRPAEAIDNQRYQTVYASDQGSVAAPTAGLHFTEEVLGELRRAKVPLCKLSLHVGSGTFRPVKGARLAGHEMHAEWLTAGRDTIDWLLKQSEGKIIAVGTTSLRAVESLYWLGCKLAVEPAPDPGALEVGQWEPYEPGAGNLSGGQALEHLLSYMERQGLQSITCKTSILVAPPYSMKLVKGLVTNFHQPGSTLLLLVAAFAGEEWKNIYRHALYHHYRFLSYGDSSLLIP